MHLCSMHELCYKSYLALKIPEWIITSLKTRVFDSMFPDQIFYGSLAGMASARNELTTLMKEDKHASLGGIILPLLHCPCMFLDLRC